MGRVAKRRDLRRREPRPSRQQPRMRFSRRHQTTWPTRSTRPPTRFACGAVRSIADRQQFVAAFLTLLKDSREELARIVTLENGKTIRESRAEVDSALDRRQPPPAAGRRVFRTRERPLHARSHDVGEARAGRRGRHHQPVELPDERDVPEDAAGAPDRQHRRVQTGHVHAVVRYLHGPAFRTRGIFARRVQLRHRPWIVDRQRASSTILASAQCRSRDRLQSARRFRRARQRTSRGRSSSSAARTR